MARPKLDNPSTSKERLEKARKKLAEDGGQRLELRLSGEAVAHLKIIMALHNFSNKKAAIEWCLMACKANIVRTDTKNKSTA